MAKTLHIHAAGTIRALRSTNLLAFTTQRHRRRNSATGSIEHAQPQLAIADLRTERGKACSHAGSQYGAAQVSRQ
jgi:hypothetical protein